MSGESFGTIRWDGQYPTFPIHSTDTAFGEQNCLCDSRYQFRSPLHGTIIGANVLQFMPTQATFDAEITFCSNLGFPHYWAYLNYPENYDLSNGLHFHMSSSIGSLMKFCLMVQSGTIGNYLSYQPTIDALITNYFSKSFYYLLPSGKPLLYIYYLQQDLASFWNNSITNLQTAINYLISRITSIKGTAPYVVALVGANDTLRTQLSANAISAYSPPFTGPANMQGTYASLDSQTQSYWATLTAATTGGMVPICTMGADPTPRIRRPIPSNVAYTGDIQIPEMGYDYSFAFPTNAEATSHVQAAKAYVNAHSATCPEKTILCYAWNECTEGGILIPTHGDPTGSRITAIKAGF